MNAILQHLSLSHQNPTSASGTLHITVVLGRSGHRLAAFARPLLSSATLSARIEPPLLSAAEPYLKDFRLLQRIGRVANMRYFFLLSFVADDFATPGVNDPAVTAPAFGFSFLASLVLRCCPLAIANFLFYIVSRDWYHSLAPPGQEIHIVGPVTSASFSAVVMNKVNRRSSFLPVTQNAFKGLGRGYRGFASVAQELHVRTRSEVPVTPPRQFPLGLMAGKVEHLVASPRWRTACRVFQQCDNSISADN